MEGKVQLIIILIELCSVPACDQREYILVEKALSWSEAQNYCRSTYTDMVNIKDSEENEKTVKASIKWFNGHIWIGLRHYPWRWKWSIERKYNVGINFSSWDENEPNDLTGGRETCTVTRNGLWLDSPCSDTRGFFCLTGSSGSPVYTYINTPMTWTSALEHCRKHHVDLAVIRNPTENDEIKNMVLDEYNWIGLYREPWKWSNGKALSYIKWNQEEPDQVEEGPCVLLHKGQWEDHTCQRTLFFVCIRYPVWKKVVRVKVTPTPFTEDLDESAENILQQWNQKVKEFYPGKDVKIRWRKRSDGKIFHSEKKENQEKVNPCLIDS